MRYRPAKFLPDSADSFRFWQRQSSSFGAFYPLLSLAIISTVVACQGKIGDGDGTNNVIPGSSPPQAPIQLVTNNEACKDATLGDSTVRRYSKKELGYIALDEFGLTDSPFKAVTGDPVGPKTVGEQLSSDSGFTQAYLDAVEDLAEQVLSQGQEATDCGPGGDDDRCFDTVVERRLGRLYGGNAEQESARLRALYDRLAQDSSLSRSLAAQGALAAALISPHFLFTERSDFSEGVRSATSFEVAAQLALVLWSSLPDDELLLLARQDSLRDEATVEAQVLRMLQDPKGERFIAEFTEQWLALDSIGADRVDAKSLGFDESEWRLVVDDMLQESREFLKDAFTRDLPASDLLTAKHTFINSRLASFYGYTGDFDDTFSRYEYGAEDSRVGLLSHGSILVQGSSGTHPELVKRGAAALTRFLCQPPPDPPDTIFDQINAQLDAPLSDIEKMEQRASNPVCRACHATLDPVGYTFHVFDALGRHREKDEHGVSIEPSGSIRQQSYTSADELMNILADEDQLYCTNEHLLTYVASRGFDIQLDKNDRCLAESIHFVAQSEGIRSQLLSIFKSPAVLARHIPE